ncbi:MAG TPA: methyltransferase domain-containing protein [Anaerolineae bacterium]|jgi:ubiquinone/menaquinone biosynthesis C-methylase UbiE|nr:methyltransferase domain-containing protein [Anaerolineae bacterium]
MSPLVAILILALIALFLYWQLVLAEGAYLGKRVVAFLYNITAKKYNHIKHYSAKSDAEYLGIPLSLSLQGTTTPLVLDVATGTSRLPLTLFNQKSFRGQVVALDNARRMLNEATLYVAAYRDRLTWVWQHSVPLPFEDNSFDAVTCLEALEFMPGTPAALQECIRVLKPGGILLVSNRISSGRWQMPGKTLRQQNFEAMLKAFGQSDVTTQIWQIDYDLVWSIKPAGPTDTRSADALDALRCPTCQAKFQREEQALICANQHRFPIGADGVIEML